jgi:hypothetical protein
MQASGSEELGVGYTIFCTKGVHFSTFPQDSSKSTALMIIEVAAQNICADGERCGRHAIC